MEVENSGKVGGTVREKWKEWALLILAGILLAVVCLTAALTAPDYAPPTVIYPEETAPISSESTVPTPVAVLPATSALLAEETDVTQHSPPPASTAVAPTTGTTETVPHTTEPTQSKTAAVTGKININTATQQQLMTLDGIGETLSARIIAYRESHGGFDSIEELKNVSGIGDKRFANIRDRVSVD